MARKMKRESRFSRGRRRCFSLSQQPGHKRHAATSRSTRAERCYLLDPPSGFTGHPSPRGCSPFMARPCPARCTTASRRTPLRTTPPPTRRAERVDVMCCQRWHLVMAGPNPCFKPCHPDSSTLLGIMSCHGWHHVAPTSCHARDDIIQK